MEFDANSAISGLIEVKIVSLYESDKDYSKIGYVFIPTSTNHFAYTFVMNDPTDLNAVLTFNLGKSSVWIPVSAIRQ